ncbi:hypothetical protein F2Q70_00010403 [Brassica cretica]|uniref:GRF-type domain-containing protein n=1 Tax=Brassica cretica TaxID=69181 RepID=A0A8S9LXZ1_BRACR|nr:hypothetical protein F2Q70_00010403 [Brassica cretica]
MNTSRRHSYGVPSRCWCGKVVVIFYSRTGDNPYRRFYRCEIGAQWVDDALLDEIRRVEAEQGRIVEEIEDLKRVLPPHGRTEEIWNVDVDRLYVPVHEKVQGVGWVRKPYSAYCQGSSAYETPEGLAFGAYTVSYVPVGKLNKSACDCGVYAVKFIECHALGLELSLLHDGNIIEARHRVLWDLWEAANDSELIDRMSKYQSPECLSSTVEEIM